MLENELYSENLETIVYSWSVRFQKKINVICYVKSYIYLAILY